MAKHYFALVEHGVSQARPTFKSVCLDAMKDIKLGYSESFLIYEEDSGSGTITFLGSVFKAGNGFLFGWRGNYVTLRKDGTLGTRRR